MKRSAMKLFAVAIALEIMAWEACVARSRSGGIQLVKKTALSVERDSAAVVGFGSMTNPDSLDTGITGCFPSLAEKEKAKS